MRRSTAVLFSPPRCIRVNSAAAGRLSDAVRLWNRADASRTGRGVWSRQPDHHRFDRGDGAAGQPLSRRIRDCDQHPRRDGHIAILSASNRMPLAQIATRIGGGITVAIALIAMAALW
ncbi:2-hydroxycarboxylate transporter family protein [Falsirhodobacter xinxiangensis]|uniref:2-hydroxycarboxylate transporter family protein n=1 Tax=Falsirhodobacter xinxiangensis TaxID=2530049 RepID=UPI0010AB15CE